MVKLALFANALALLILALTLELARRWIDGEHKDYYTANPWNGGA